MPHTGVSQKICTRGRSSLDPPRRKLGRSDLFRVIIAGYTHPCYSKERKKERELFAPFKINDKKNCLMISFHSFMFKKYLSFCIENSDLHLHSGNNLLILYAAHSSLTSTSSYHSLAIVPSYHLSNAYVIRGNNHNTQIKSQINMRASQGLNLLPVTIKV